MYLVTFVSIIAVLLTYLDSRKVINNGMQIGFVLVTILGVLHYNYGNDYLAYYEIYKDVELYSFNIDSILNGDYFRDSGWVLLCYLFKPIGGFFTMVAALTITQNIIIYKFIKREVDLPWRPLTVFIFLFTTSLYLMSFSMFRQFFVMCVFLSLWPLIKCRKWVRAILILFVCSFIHSSSIILLPFAFWGFIPFKHTKLWMIGFAVIFIVLWLSKSLIQDIFDKFLMIDQLSSYGRYLDYDRDALDSVGVGYVIKLIPFFVGEYYFLKAHQGVSDKNQIIALSMISFMITPFTQIVDLFSRFSFYFELFSMATIPLTYQFIPNKKVRSFLIILFILITLLDYSNFFSNPMWLKHYGTYHTIIPIILG